MKGRKPTFKEDAMKKLLALILVLSALFTFVSCDIIESKINGIRLPFTDFTEDELPPIPNNNGGNGGNNNQGAGNGGQTATHTYKDFTPSEKNLMQSLIGCLVPFIPNDEYYLEEYNGSDIGLDGEHGVNFYTYGNTDAEFSTYLESFAAYNLVDTYEDDYGDTWYVYSKDSIYFELGYYQDDGGVYVVDVYAYYVDNVDNPGSGGGTQTPGSTVILDAEITNSMPSGLTYITNNSEYPTPEFYNTLGGLKMRFVNQGVLTSTFTEQSAVKVTIVINSLNENQKSDTAGVDAFTVYGLDKNGNTVATATLNTLTVGDGNTVTLTANGIVAVKVIMTDYYSNGSTCFNVGLGGIKIEGTSAGSGNTGSGNTGSGNTGSGSTDTTNSKEDSWRKTYDCITVGEALAICDQAGSTATSERYYIIGTVVNVSNASYGEMTVKDSTGEIFVYGTYSADGVDRYSALASKPVAGDVVLLYANLMTYNGTREVKSGWIIDFYTPGQSGSGNTGSGNTGSGSSSTHTYNDFTSSEKALMNERIGFVIPFIPNDDYIVEEYNGEDYGIDGEYGIFFCTVGNTSAEYSAYRQMFSYYTYDGTEDVDGYTFYYYSKGDVLIDLVYYYNYDGEYYIELYAYVTDYDGSGSGSGSDSGSGSGTVTDSDVITNAGAGLPTDSDGVYDTDFTKAHKVKDVTDQGSYLDGCPTTGSPAVLVIPVQFTDVTAASKGYTTSALASALGKNGQTDYYSLYDYYYISSYGQLTLDITVLDFWFTPEKSSSYYYNATYDYYGQDVAIGDQLILDEALEYLATIYDLSDYDTDGNSIIDSVILVNTLDVGEEDFYWAYRYWNIYTDEDGYYYEYDGVSANDYVWLSYQFLYETYDENGEITYDSSARNTSTFIHEFAHVLGVDDYYDTSSAGNHPLENQDIMDSMTGDHNAYTKFNLGWITTSRLVVTGSSVTLTLEDFSKGGDTIIIANNWDDSLGAYQEYYLLVYYKNTGLNGGEAGYFARDGVIVYHVNASLYSEVYDGETYYDVYNNNTDPSDQYGTEDNLIEFVKSASGTFTYVVGDTLPSVTDDQGNTLGYTFTVDSITENYATITFTAK